MTKIKLIAVVGKSASGKNYLQNKWAKERGYHKVVSSTTRSPREKEKEGVDYHFLTEEEFAAVEFLESSTFRGWHYGTRYTDLDPNHVNIGVFNPDGIYQLVKHPEIDLTVVYIMADDKTRLLRQLQREDNPDVKEIMRRYETDDYDFYHFEIFLAQKKGLKWSLFPNDGGAR